MPHPIAERLKTEGALSYLPRAQDIASSAGFNPAEFKPEVLKGIVVGDGALYVRTHDGALHSFHSACGTVRAEDKVAFLPGKRSDAYGVVISISKASDAEVTWAWHA